ncbi:MAG: glycosyltransferase [Gemmataceae bacterium]|nr:glycosyltransferase [Gemmataceae bacterium]MCI0740242.1 glycosyltransferase [Gemmataceae bacterium]
MRVLHGPVNVGNQPWVLSRHERALGIQSDLVVRSDSWLRYPADLHLVRPNRLEWLNYVSTALFALTAPFRYDVFHYYFGQSYLHGPKAARLRAEYLDMRLARKLGRKIFMTLQGCDVRISAASAERNSFSPCQVGRCSAAVDCRASLDDQRRWLVHNVLPRCDRVFVLNPDLAWDAPGATFLPYASVDIEGLGHFPPKTEGRITLLHAPSDESIKGTRFIVAAVEWLKQRWPIDLVLVHGLPYSKALPLYQSADLVIDQVLLSWYGGFAVETMAMGKPVACHIREQDLDAIPDAMRADLPLLRLNPRDLEQQLEEILQRRREWPAWGRRCRDYVFRWHHPRKIAQAMVDAYGHPQSRFDLPGIVDRAARQAA